MQRNAQLLKVESRSFFASFCKVTSGLEEEMFAALTADHSDVACFKALGEYDVVAFASEVALNGRDLPTASSLISSCINLPLVPFSLGDYASPDLLSWLAISPVAGFVLLEFDKSLYKKQKPSVSISHVISYFKSSSENSLFDNLGFFLGIGQSELIAIVRAESFEDIFQFAAACRKLTFNELLNSSDRKELSRLNVFSSTHTTPLVSYKAVIVPPKGFNRIKGSVSAHIFVDCPTGFEANIRDSELFPGAITRSVLGTPDLLISIHSIRSADLVRQLLKFRKSNHSDLPVTDTTTFLSFDVVFEKQAPRTCDQVPVNEYPNFSNECPGFDDQEPNLAARIRAVTHRIWSKLCLPSSNPMVARMAYVPMRLYGEAQKFSDHVVSDRDSTSRYKGDLINLLEKAETGLTQRTQSSFTSSGVPLHIPPHCGDGVLASLLAVENFVDFIFRCFYETNPNCQKPGWRGYVFFQETMGFQYTIGDVFSLPSSAISSPLSPDWNWTTLTHEISHAIFTILNIDQNDSKLIMECGMRALSYDGKCLDERDKEENQNHFFELFAHWFDYYHFFNEDHNFYQKTIWYSWLSVPLVHKDQMGYIFRSFAVFVLQDVVSLHQSVCAATESEFLDKCWSEFLLFVNQDLIEVAKVISFDSKREPVLILATDYLYPFSFLARKYRLDKFREKLNAEPENFRTQIDLIFDGVVIQEPIDNPFLLIREATRRSYDCAPRSDIRAASTSLIFSLRDATQFERDSPE